MQSELSGSAGAVGAEQHLQPGECRWRWCSLSSGGAGAVGAEQHLQPGECRWRWCSLISGSAGAVGAEQHLQSGEYVGQPRTAPCPDWLADDSVCRILHTRRDRGEVRPESGTLPAVVISFRVHFYECYPMSDTYVVVFS